MDTESYILIALGIVAIIVELLLGAATGFDLLIIGIVFVVSGVLGVVFHSFFVAMGFVISLLLLYVFIGRKIVKNTLSIDTKKTNIDSILGKKGVVVKKITPHHPGQVKVEGETWRAESEDAIDVHREVLIQSVTGITLKVAPV
ncbi:MAG: NfeD family protein [Patescibacteria group bacterium]